MHQHTQAEADTLASEHYSIEVRTAISLLSEGINITTNSADGSVTFPHVSFPANKRGVMALKPLTARILGYEPFLSATISADLDQPLSEAEIRLHLAGGADSLSPFMTGPAWDWLGFFGGATQTEFRPLFDVGVYIQLQGRYVSQTPRFITPEISFVGRGTVRATAGTGLSVVPEWPGGHAPGDIGLLFVETANEAATLPVTAGFSEIPNSPLGTGTAGSSGATRLAVYWCRAISTTMASPAILNPGNHVIAHIAVWRGCRTSGFPWVDTPLSSVLATASTTATTPTVTLTVPKTRVICAVAGATDTTDNQMSTPLIGNGTTFSPGNPRGDRWRDIGNGGGFVIWDGARAGGTDLGPAFGMCNLATSTAQSRFTIPLVPEPPHAILDDPNTAPWRPFFTGRIDSVDPAGGDDELVLRCRDIYSDTLDDWMVPQSLGQNGFTMANEEGDDVGNLLARLFVLRSFIVDGNYFAVQGDPAMIVPTYFQEAMSPLLAMRAAGLQNGWDLRPRWGTPPYGQDQLVLTYYEPDRGRSGLVTNLDVSRYFALSSMGKSRDGVRNRWRVTPSDPPRTAVEVRDSASEVKYGYRPAAITEDATSLIQTAAQAAILADALLSDTAEPKVMAEVERRFFPYVEINDNYLISPNNVHYDGQLACSVTGYTHTLGPQPSEGTTVLRTRSASAAANLEWRQRSGAKTIYISDADPTGSAVQGARWHKVRS